MESLPETAAFESALLEIYNYDENRSMYMHLHWARVELDNLRDCPKNWLWLERLNRRIESARAIAIKWDHENDSRDCQRWISQYHKQLLAEYVQILVD